jgi:hypothetical protein
LAVVSEQPPIALTGASTVVTNHGTYTIEASSGTVVNLFDKVIGEIEKWQTDDTYDSNDGSYDGSANLTGVDPRGEWAKITMPYKTILRHVKIESTNSSIKDVTLVGLNSDGLTWSDLKTVTGLTGTTHTIIVNATTHHRTYGLIVRATNVGSSQAEINDLKLFTESFSIDGGKVEMASSAIMGGETTMDQHGPHGRGEAKLKKYPDIAFESGKFDYNTTTNTFVQAGYTITSSGNFSDDVNSVYTAWRAFTGLINLFDPGWVSPSGSYTGGVANSTQSLTNIDTATSTGSVSSRNGAWIKLELPTKIKLGRVDFYDRYDDIEGTATQYERVSEAFVYGGNSNSGPWYEIGKQSDATNLANYTDNIPASLTIDTTSYYKYYIIQPTQLAKTISYASYGQLMFYGYEELATEGDTSVDTTFTSIMNTPQTTGANVYIDGNLGETLTNRVTGPDVTGPSATYDSTGKYWELNGTLTSNIAVEANTFLEGDQPHAVSVWFNSSNLEANVSNTCVFSISDQEKLDSVNLDLQSNTWHNLTYAYQGEGGSRVTYLDGRKVAEDQAEDTFGDYPPFAMTGYSQGGYVVSESSMYDSSYPGWKVFDDTVLTSWESTPNTASLPYAISSPGSGSSFGYATNENAAITTLGDSSTVSGEWIQMKFPHKISVNSVDIMPQTTLYTRMPGIAVFLGSNSGNDDWVTLATVSKEGATFAEAVYSSFTVNATTAYSYIRIIWKTLHTQSSAGLGRAGAAEIKIYGHRENDLVRLPDPTNVLKYPHIAMTGPAQRGYVASASSVWTGYNPWETFDENNPVGGNTGAGAGWASSGPSTSYDTYNGSTGENLGITSHHTGSVTGEWIQIELPTSIILSSIDIESRSETSYNANGNDHGYPKDVVLYGSLDGSSWSTVKSFTTVDKTASEKHTEAITSSTAYKYYTLVVESIHVTSSTSVVWCTIGQLRLYGTGVDSIPIQIGGGNIDKVANFRVYDKFIGEDQALEIWDAQKDEFGRAKSSMTLQKGRLGLGTTEPEGRLAVLDEPHNLEEFPPRAMTGYKTYFEGHGEFKVIDSTFQAGGQEGWQAFNGIYGVSGNGDAWLSGNDPTYNADGTSTGISSINGEAGEYVILEMPYRVKMKNVLVYPRGHNSSTQSYSNPPKDGKIWGRNDADDFWTEIASYTNLNFGATITDNLNGQHPQHVVINATQYYKYIAFQVQVANHNLSTTTVYTNIRELRYFGTREQGQSVLHDGQLTLTKSLTVPRIGPALDADDTPRRDRLVVEYNTSTNPTFEGAVRDTSGRGLDAILRDATYNATEKSFRVGSSQDIFLAQGIPGKSGDITNVSFSIWFRADSVSSGSQMIMSQISAYAVNVGFNLVLNYDHLQIGIGGVYSASNGRGGAALNAIIAGQWYHVVGIKKGAGEINSTTYDDIFEMYINGEKKTLTHGGGTGTLNMGANHWLIIGAIRDVHSTTEEFIGDVSSIKYYDTALTAQEVKTLYDMGRTGHIVNPQPLHIAAPVQVEKTLRIPVDNTDTGAYTVGMIRYNQDLGKIQVHNGSVWLTVGGVSATGGTVTNDEDGYTIHTFTGLGTFTVYSGGEVEYLVVAGGGGGGHDGAGGGGAGGLLTGTIQISPGNYTITVGAGGSASTTVSGQASDGSSSSIGTLVTAAGGGGGGSKQASGRNGGSGGGGGHPGGTGGTGTPGQGGNGGNGVISGGGGGGGAGGSGGNAISNTSSGNGGIGLESGINGTLTYYAGGGGGGSYSHGGGTGGNGGGGDGGNQVENASQAGGLNTGGGGGGDGLAGDPGGSNGGSGIVIIRYLT